MTSLDIQQKMEFILNVGQILAEHGATSDKIIASAKRVAVFMQISAENFNLKVMPSVLYLNVFDGEKMNVAFRNYENHGVDMNIINLTGAFTLRAAKRNYSPEKFQAVLRKITAQKKIYSHTQIILSTGLFCGAFCFLFGGDLWASFYTAVAAVMGKFFQLKFIKHGMNHFFAVTIAAFVATFTAYFAHFLPTQTMWLPLIACSLFLIPGIPIINAITESLRGFLLNGMIKAYHSFLIAVSLTCGIVFAVMICDKMEEIDLTNLTLSASHNFIELLLAGIIVSVSFSIFINVPKKILKLLGFFGVIALITKNFLIYRLNFPPEIAVFIAALLIGSFAVKAKNYTYAPTQVLTVPAIISFVPGVLIYRFLASCMYIRSMDAEEFWWCRSFVASVIQTSLYSGLLTSLQQVYDTTEICTGISSLELQYYPYNDSDFCRKRKIHF